MSSREALEREESQRLQQSSVEEQINTLHQSLQDQTAAAKSSTAGLEAKLEDVQKQIAEVITSPIFDELFIFFHVSIFYHLIYRPLESHACCLPTSAPSSFKIDGPQMVRCGS